MNIDYTLLANGVSAAAALASAVAGGLSWRAAAAASEAANRSAKLADDTERQRRWERLQPDLSCNLYLNPNGASGLLTIRLDGPYALERLDRVTVTIRDQRLHPGHYLLKGMPNPEQARAPIWGPYRFDQDDQNQAVHQGGRVVSFAAGISVGDQIGCQLSPTVEPTWVADDAPHWELAYDGAPVRVMVECEKSGFSPWRIPIEAPTEQPPQIH